MTSVQPELRRGNRVRKAVNKEVRDNENGTAFSEQERRREERER